LRRQIGPYREDAPRSLKDTPYDDL
jgi:hypothetical protein